jgi:hypothetical protein
MPALTLRRAGFAATLLTGLVLLASGIHGLAGVDTTLQLADASSRPTLVSYHDRPAMTPTTDSRWRDCEGRHDLRRLT